METPKTFQTLQGSHSQLDRSSNLAANTRGPSWRVPAARALWPGWDSGQLSPLQPRPASDTSSCHTCGPVAHPLLLSPPVPGPGTCRNHIPNPSADTSFNIRPIGKVTTEDGRWGPSLHLPPSHDPQDGTSGPVNAGLWGLPGYGFSDHVYFMSLLSQ